MFFRYINIYYVTHHIAATDYNIWIGLLKIQIRANTSRHRTNTFQENVIFNRKQGLCFKGMCRYGTLQFCLALKSLSSKSTLYEKILNFSIPANLSVKKTTIILHETYGSIANVPEYWDKVLYLLVISYLSCMHSRQSYLPSIKGIMIKN